MAIIVYGAAITMIAITTENAILFSCGITITILIYILGKIIFERNNKNL